MRAVTALALLVLASCGGQPAGSGRVRLFLTDAPLDGATAVNVDITGVELHYRGSGEDGGSTEQKKLTVAESVGTVNLLDYRDGRTKLLGEVQVDGTVEQIRLLMGGTVTVVFEDGSERSARVPSGAQSGIKIIVPELEPAATTDIVLDFDAAKSIHETGGGELIMRPTIKALVGGELVGENEDAVEGEPTDATDGGTAGADGGE